MVRLRAHPLYSQRTGTTALSLFGRRCSALLPCTSSEQRELAVRGEGGVAIVRSMVRILGRFLMRLIAFTGGISHD